MRIIILSTVIIMTLVVQGLCAQEKSPLVCEVGSDIEGPPLEKMQNALECELGSTVFFGTISNPYAKGDALLVRTFFSNQMQLVYQPKNGRLAEKDPKYQSIHDYTIEPYGRTTGREILIGYDEKTHEYMIYYNYDNYRLNVMDRGNEQIRMHEDGLSFLIENFQVLAIDNPVLALGIKYLQSKNGAAGIKLNLKRRYLDIELNEVKEDENGGVYTTMKMRPLQSTPLTVFNFLEEAGLSKKVRYYPMQDGLEIREVAGDKEKRSGFISKKSIFTYLGGAEKKALVPKF